MSISDEDQFHTTQWSEIHKARTVHGLRRREAVNALTKRYWRPVYTFLRRKGYNHDETSDLVQGFFLEIILERNLFQQADKAKGRFRTYLLTALTRYVAELHRKANTRKRKPMNSLLSLDMTDIQDLTAVESTASPEQAFQYTWASSLLDQVLEEVEREFRGDGKEAYWQVFHQRVVLPIIEGIAAPTLSDLCRRYHIETEKKASNMIITVKRRFRRGLERNLRQTMDSDGNIEEELSELIAILS